jgi:hypothetical protein
MRTALAALALAVAAAGCRAIVGVDDKYLVDAGAGGCGGSTGAVECPPATKPSIGIVPATTGCADGSREGFLNGSLFPTIAACGATWAAQSMRAPPTGVPCGNDLGECATPADACAEGWHVCLRQGYPGDLTSRISADDCAPSTTTVPAMFLAAADQQGGHSCGPPLPCSLDDGWSIAVCCGQECILSQSSCVFPDKRTPFGAAVCGDAHSGASDGVLCCMDPEITN